MADAAAPGRDTATPASADSLASPPGSSPAPPIEPASSSPSSEPLTSHFAVNPDSQLPTSSPSSFPPLPPPVPSLPPLDSPRPPPVPAYLPSSIPSSLPPLPPLPPSFTSLSPNSLTRSLLDLTHASTSLSDLRAYAASLHSTLSALTSRLEAVTQSRAQSVAHLQREVLKKEAVVNELMAERVGLMKEVEGIRRQAREEVGVERERLAERSRRMEAELSGVKQSYAALKHFATDKAKLEAELVQLQAELEGERQAHQADVCELERRNILEKEKMKNSMLHKIRQTKLSLLAQTESQLSMLTRRTMLENAQVVTELMYQSKETEKMNAQFESMTDKEKQSKREGELWKQEKQLMTNKLHHYGKVIKHMQQQLRDKEKGERGGGGGGGKEERKEDDLQHLAHGNPRSKRAAHAV